jgi:hypothetical protein
MTRAAHAATTLLAACLVLASAGCRKDDALEPNDTYETATLLQSGNEALATAYQNNPDVFSIEVPAGGTLVFKLSSRGHEDCPEFVVLGPKEDTLYQDEEGLCTDPWKAKVQKPGVSASGGRGAGYEFRISAKEAGKYYLRIQERRQADNLFGYSWDYSLTASLE